MIRRLALAVIVALAFAAPAFAQGQSYRRGLPACSSGNQFLEYSPGTGWTCVSTISIDVTDPATELINNDSGVPVRTLEELRYRPTSAGSARTAARIAFLEIPTAGAGLPQYGSLVLARAPSTVTGNTSAIRGIHAHAINNGQGATNAELTGVMGWSIHGGSGAQSHMTAVRGFAHQIGAGTVSSMRGLQSEVYIDPGGEGDVTNAYGVKIDIVHSNVGAGRWQALYGTAIVQTGPAAETQAIGHYVGELAGPAGASYAVYGAGLDDPIATLAWFEGAARPPIATKTANYTATVRDGLILCDATAGAVTITLPTAASAFLDGFGFQFSITKIDASANACTLEGDGAETIDGAANFSTTTQWAGVTVLSNGTAWFSRK